MSIRTRIKRAWRGLTEAPRRRMYGGAMGSRLTASWVASSTSADTEIKGSLSRLRNRSRQLVRDNDYAKQAVRSVVNNVVGPNGIRLQAQVKMQRGGGRLDTLANERIEKAWKTWGRKQNCDVSGMLSWQEIERVAMQSIAESGEIFIRVVQKTAGNSRIPFSLQVLESDLCDEEYQGKGTQGRSYWRLGIERDAETHRPLNYAFFKNHPGDNGVGSATSGRTHLIVPADQVIHCFLQTRPSQTRGVPMLASSLERLHHVSGMEKAEVVRSRAASCLMGFITSPDGELTGDDVVGDERVQNWEPGSWHYLAPGESVSVPQIDSPDGQYEPFLRAQLQGVAAGMGCDYSSVSGDYSRTNYSSSRLALVETRAHWQSLQHYLIENLHRNIYERWLEMAVISGELSFSGFELDRERYYAAHWIPRAWPWIDPQKEVASYKEAIMCGFKTQAEIVREQGGDLEELLLQRQREIEMAESLGIKFSTSIMDNVSSEPQQQSDNDEQENDTGGSPEAE